MATATTSSNAISGEAVLLTRAQAAGIDIRAMVENVPEADEDSAVDIVIQLAAAGTLEDLDAPWQLGGLTKYVGKWLRVTALKRLPSDYADGLGFYLILTATNLDGGEVVTVSTGSVSVVMQLVRAYTLGLFPLVVQPVLAAKPSKSGYYPMHLSIARREDQPNLGQPATS